MATSRALFGIKTQNLDNSWKHITFVRCSDLFQPFPNIRFFLQKTPGVQSMRFATGATAAWGITRRLAPATIERHRGSLDKIRQSEAGAVGARDQTGCAPCCNLEPDLILWLRTIVAAESIEGPEGRHPGGRGRQGPLPPTGPPCRGAMKGACRCLDT